MLRSPSYRIPVVALLAASLLSAGSKAEDGLTVDQALTSALRDNPELGAAQADSEAEQAAVVSRYWPESPTLEFMRESNPESTNGDMGGMDWWGVSQELMFPLKYVYAGAAQSSAAKAARERARRKAHKIREMVIESYFEFATMTRTLDLFLAQRETLREISRIAESRRATGAVPQQDEMKAHVEQTKIETEILMARQELESARVALNAVLNRSPGSPVAAAAKELPIAKLTINTGDLAKLIDTSSSVILEKRFGVEQASRERAMARLSCLPDFMLSYRKPFRNAQSDAYEFTVGLTVPLWFFAKQFSETAVAGAKLIMAEKELEMSLRETEASAHSLLAKAKASQEILHIYNTSLIPQATTSLNSSRAAYQAGRVGFADFLDSERSLYEIRINYYRTLLAHVKNVLALETALGASVSSLPFLER